MILKFIVIVSKDLVIKTVLALLNLFTKYLPLSLLSVVVLTDFLEANRSKVFFQGCK